MEGNNSNASDGSGGDPSGRLKSDILRERWLKSQEQKMMTDSASRITDEREDVALARKAATSTIYSKHFSHNSTASKLALFTTLERALGNILFEPSKDKFRVLRSQNAVIKSKVLDVRGGLDLLVAAGFKTTTHDFETLYVLEGDGKGNELDKVKGVLEIIKTAREDMEKNEQRKRSHVYRQREDSEEQKKQLLSQLAGDKRERKLEGAQMDRQSD